MDQRRRYRFLGLAVVLAWALAMVVVFVEPDYLREAIIAFGSTASLGAAGTGIEGTARNWAGQKEPPAAEE